VRLPPCDFLSRTRHFLLARVNCVEESSGSVGSDKFIDRDYRLLIVISLSIDKRSISIIIINKSGSQLLSEPYYINISLSSSIIN
jgi:hypothetical protein